MQSENVNKSNNNNHNTKLYYGNMLKKLEQSHI